MDLPQVVQRLRLGVLEEVSLALRGGDETPGAVLGWREEGDGAGRGRGVRAALAPHLEDSDVPGEALQRLLQLAAPQPLLGLDAVQLLVEIHPCMAGRGAQWVQGRWHRDSHHPRPTGTKPAGSPLPTIVLQAGWAPHCPSSLTNPPCLE